MSRSKSSKPNRGQIPGTMVLNWHSTGIPQTARPIVRRPMTACAACRAAKVRCNGKQECERCLNRGLRCVYTSTVNNVTTPITPNSDVTSGVLSATDGATDGSMSTDSTISNRFVDSLNLMDRIDSMGTSEDAFTQALKELNWELPDGNLNILESHQASLGEPDSFITSGTSPTDFAMLDAATTVNANSYVLSESSHSQLIQPDSKSLCQCRSLLMSHIPKLEMVMQEAPKTRLDHVLKATEEVIAGCQAAIDCPACQVGPVDLVCIASVFQQTASCFGYITRSMIDGTVRVSIGDYEVSVADDTVCKSMVVSNLVKQASMLLDSMTRLGQDQLLQSQQQHSSQPRRMNRSPACLKQVNLEYVREVVANFRKFFRLITMFEERQSSERS